MTTVLIPLNPSDPNYDFQIDLNGNVYLLSFRWNTYDSAWYMHLLGLQNEEDFPSVKLVTGANLLKPYAILELGAMYVIDGEDLGEDPTFDEMGSRWQLYHSTDVIF